MSSEVVPPNAGEAASPDESEPARRGKKLQVGFPAFACGVIGFVAAMLIFGKPWHLPPNWGDVPTWFLVALAAGGGWFTLSQLVVQRDALDEQKKSFAAQLKVLKQQATDEKQAFADQLKVQKQQLVDQNEAFERQLAVQQKQLDEQKAAFQRDSDDRRRAQAKLVFLWTEEVTDSVLTQAQHASMGTTSGRIQVTHVRNTSKQPVYDPQVSMYDGKRFHNSMDMTGVLMPDSGSDLKEELPDGKPRYRVTLSFRDAAGVRWQVDEGGNLEEVK